MILVTGGTGFVGSRLKLIKPDWTYISSKDYDLTDKKQAKQMFVDHKNIDAVLHLAGIVGGIKKNSQQQAEFFYKNVLMNTNVIHEAYLAGVPRLLASLSTCAFPDIVSDYPFDEGDIFSGPPAQTNFSYGYTKRMLHVQVKSYRQQYGVNYSTFCPSNIYGPGDNFDLNSSHFVPAMIKKLHEARDGDEIEFWGTGKPLRQQLYIDDLVDIIPKLIDEHNTDIPLIVSPGENISIDEMINIFLKNINKEVTITYNGFLEGQFRKDGSNERFKKLFGDYKFTNFKDGIRETHEWYIRHVL